VNRFDYVEYDHQSRINQNVAKHLCQDLEKFIDKLEPGRAKFLAYTRLEECYAWIGKAIRDEQHDRMNGVKLQEERGNS
jgi:hypothetical protein